MLKQRRKSKDLSSDQDPLSTPITNYKNRRKLMQENKIKQKEKLENGEDVDDIHGTQTTSGGSFIGSVTSSFNKNRKSNKSYESNYLEDTSTGFLNSLGFSKNEQKDLE